ncbi:hypothetical protein AAG906_027619 [Vitis piasezkii]
MGYNNAADADSRGKKKVALMGFSSILLVAMVVGTVVTVNHRNGSSSSATDDAQAGGGISTSVKAIQAICQPTDYKEACVNSLTSAKANTSDPKELVRTAFQVAINQISSALQNSTTLRDLEKDPRTKGALENCHELMDYAIDDLRNSFNKLGVFDISKIDDYVEDLKIWLSGALTYQETCLDGFENTTGDAGEKMKALLKSAGELTSNGLAMIDEISSVLTNLQIPGISRRLLSDESGKGEYRSDEGGLYPSWASVGQRKLFQATPDTIKPNVIVAQDGSGKYKTINEALVEIPKNGNTTFVLYVKEGVYKEQVNFTKSMTNVMLIGDGPTKTTISGSLNFIDGIGTFRTATVAAVGSNFMAKDIGFENNAGASKHQAVALRVGSDMAIFYNCRMDGFQDTLYVHAHRQFYRDCTITGTIDFIFGDSAVVFQNCLILVRKPLDNQQCIVTAQGRNERREPTGIVLQNCTISAADDYIPFKTKFKSYLGRPWKAFSRTIIMQSQIDDLISPEGWLPWMGDFGLNTCFYAEYGNRGPGSATTSRVTWRGIKQITDQHVNDFTVGRFISGHLWLGASGVPYTSDMMAV